MGASPATPAPGAACSLPTPTRHGQQQGPFPATNSTHTLVLTGEEEAGLSNPSSPSIARGLLATADGVPLVSRSV